MRPQIGMILHYVPLDADGKPTTPKPALVMGLDEHDPPNLDLHVFRPPSEGAGQEVMTLVPPASTTVTGSGWAVPDWMAPDAINVPPLSLSTDAMRETVRDMLAGTAEMAQGRAALAEGDGTKREGQEGSVILLVLGSVLLAGALSTALGL